MKRISIFLLFYLPAILLNAQDIQLQLIDSIIDSKLKDNHPGLAVGIIKEGEIIFETYKGLSNLQHQVKFSKDTRSNIASTAKQFTALMILKMSLEGQLSLQDDIRKYLPHLYKDVNDVIRIRHLINHTSGIRDYVELLHLEGEVWWKRFGLDNDDIMALLEKQNDLGFSPGSRHAYSNSNYNVLTKIIEAVSKKTFNEYSKAFFKELGMNQTYFVERYMGVIPNRANPYSDWGRGEWWEVPTVTKTNGEGFLFTTLKDQLIYEQAMQNALKNNNELLIKSQLPIENSTIKTYGFGLKLENRLGRKAVHHDGVTYGFHSQTIRFPEENLTVFIMSNNGNIRSDLIADEIANLLLSKTPSKAQYDKRLFETSDTTEISEMLGQYYSPGDYLTRIVEEDGKTYFRQGKSLRIELIKEKNNTYHFAYDPKEKIKFYDDKLMLFSPSGDISIFKKSNELPSTFANINGFVGTYYNNELDISFDFTINSEHDLKLKFSNKETVYDVIAYNRNELLAGNNNYVIKAQRDHFNRINKVLLSYGRAKNISFVKQTHLEFQPKIKTDNGSIQVTTIGSKNGNTSDILLTENYKNGNEIWSKRLGGKSYDKASSIISTEDGYLIVGSTSSYGKGNYDMYVIKTDKQGHKLWQNTYGDFYNEYGYSAEQTDNGYLIKGTIQNCENNSDINRKCTTNVWFVSIDKNGKELSNEVLEKIKEHS